MKNSEVRWYDGQHVLSQAKDECVVGTWIFARSSFSSVRYHLFNTQPTLLYTSQLGWTTSDREDTRNAPGWRQNNVLYCDWYFPSFCDSTWIFQDAHSFMMVRWNHLTCNTSQGWYIICQLMTTIISLLTLFFFNTCLPCLFTSFFHLWLTGIHHKANMPFTHVYLISTLHSTCVHLKANTFPLPI